MKMNRHKVKMGGGRHVVKGLRPGEMACMTSESKDLEDDSEEPSTNKLVASVPQSIVEELAEEYNLNLYNSDDLELILHLVAERHPMFIGRGYDPEEPYKPIANVPQSIIEALNVPQSIIKESVEEYHIHIEDDPGTDTEFGKLSDLEVTESTNSGDLAVGTIEFHESSFDKPPPEAHAEEETNESFYDLHRGFFK